MLSKFQFGSLFSGDEFNVLCQYQPLMLWDGEMANFEAANFANVFAFMKSGVLLQLFTFMALLKLFAFNELSFELFFCCSGYCVGGSGKIRERARDD